MNTSAPRPRPCSVPVTPSGLVCSAIQPWLVLAGVADVGPAAVHDPVEVGDDHVGGARPGGAA